VAISFCVGLLVVKGKWWGFSQPIAKAMNSIANKVKDKAIRAVNALTACSAFSLLNKIKYNPEPSEITIIAIKAKTINLMIK
jgi:hypothetical protein